MRVALVTETWLPMVDGVVTRLRHSIDQLRTRGHAVLVLAPSVGPPISGVLQGKLPGVAVPFIDRRRRVGLPLPAYATGAIRRFRPDVVHVVNPVLMGWSVLRSVHGHVPTVVSFHTDLEAYTDRYRLGVTRPALRMLMRAAYGSADLPLATSPSGQARLAALGVSASLWPPGIDDALFRPGPRITSGPAWLTPEPTRALALCVGRLAPEKNWAALGSVVAAANARSASSQTRRRWHLTFIGDGPDRSRLERRFAGLPVTFAGARRPDEVAQAYVAADVLLMPSQTETVGLVLLEAAATGLPVIGADTPANRHTLRNHPGAAFIAPQAHPDQWVAAMEDSVSTDRRTPAPVSSWTAVTDELIAAYHSVVASPARADQRPTGSPDRVLSSGSVGRTARRSCAGDS